MVIFRKREFQGRAIKALVMLIVLWCMALAQPAFAAAPPVEPTCTDQPLYEEMLVDRLDSLLGDIVELVQQALEGIMESLYLGIVLSPNYQYAVTAAMTLYVAFYGVSFIFGFVPPSFSQAFFRLVKIGIVGTMLLPIGWFYFEETVVRLFGTCSYLNITCQQSAVDWLIDLMIFLGGGNPAGGHFSIMEPLLIKAFSPKMFIMVIGSLTTGPFGPIMAMALMWAIFNLFLMILKALEIYLLSLIIRTLLLGMGPIFFAMMFFDRTKHIFMGYINQLVSFSLQPVLLFAFLAFFVSMLDSSVDALLAPGHVELCYTKMEHMGKMPYDIQHWRFKVDGEIYQGEWTWKGCVDCPPFPFPINIIDILIFLILAHIGIKMSTVVVEIAAEIAQASVRLTDVPNTLNGYFSGSGRRVGASDDAARRAIVR